MSGTLQIVLAKGVQSVERTYFMFFFLNKTNCTVFYIGQASEKISMCIETERIQYTNEPLVQINIFIFNSIGHSM